MNKSAMLICAIGAILAGCGKAVEQAEPAAEAAKAEQTTSAIELSPEAQKIGDIRTETPKVQWVQEGLDVPGVVKSTTKGHAVVTPPVAGRVLEIKAQAGDKVVQGQMLAVIESTELAQQWASIAEARQARDRAVAELNQVVSEADLATAKLVASRMALARQKDMANAGAFSHAPLQEAKSELNDAQSDLLAIQKEIATHTELLRRTENLFKDGLVAKADLDLARLEVQQDQIRLAREKTRVESARATLARETTISHKGLLNAREVQTAEAEVRAALIEQQTSRVKITAAKAAIANAEKAITNAQASYRASTGVGTASVGRVVLVAPISGTITQLSITKGQAVDRTQVLLEVENLDAVWVTANVPERDAAKARIKSPVSVTVSAFPGREFRGFIQVVGSRIDPKTRSIPVQCLIGSAAGALVPDMFASVHLGFGVSKRELVVPQSAIVSEDPKRFIFVKVAGKFEKREVELGATVKDSVAVIRGLKEGEQVAVTGAFVLRSESKRDELKGEE